MAQPTFSTLRCPECGHSSREAMPLDACLYYFVCPGCERLLKPKSGDCCVFCSYGDQPCPPRLGTGGGDDRRTLWTMDTRGGRAELRLERQSESEWKVMLSMNGRRLLTHGCESEAAGVELGLQIKRRWPSQRQDQS